MWKGNRESIPLRPSRQLHSFGYLDGSARLDQLMGYARFVVKVSCCIDSEILMSNEGFDGADLLPENTISDIRSALNMLNIENWQFETLTTD